MELFYDFLFLFRQFIWVLWVDGREMAVFHRIFTSVDGDDASFMINEMQQHTVIHFKFRASADGFCFQFELDDADSFVHLC